MAETEVEARVRKAGPQLTAAERRVAQVVLEKPQLVGFGTVADLAGAAGAGAATVVRLAGKLGFDGFSALQASVQRDLARQLRPAAERIRELAGDQPIARHRSAELSNVQATLDAVDPATLDAVVGLLADEGRDVLVLAGDAEHGLGQQFAGELSALRPGVSTIGGNDVRVRRALALSPAGSTMVVVDLRRYERWVLEACAQGSAAGHTVVALTDGVLSPLAMTADHAFAISAASVSPFD
ncbi:MAG TPA: MurR/RpiR family transcriptional regulator, partial [Ilumatobacteraceae bacterium]|nr:MurR/RpiR family transcriptional regulator [Ilumatobacteraceae bacterium]